MRTPLLTTLAAGMVLAAAWHSEGAGPLQISLTVEERLGEARVMEPVTSGVPLPRGAVEDPNRFRLLDEEGNVVPAAFSAATRWWPAKSVKWLHVDFLATVPANGTKKYVLTADGPAVPVKTPLTVEKQEAVAGTLEGGERFARLTAAFTRLYEFSGAAEGSGDPHRSDPQRIGRLDLSGPAGGVTVGVKNFWQMWTKYLEARKDGTLVVGLWTKPYGFTGPTTFVDPQGRVQFFAGVGRTHEIFCYFHGPNERDPLGRVAAAREPLFARCEPAWYCRGTKVFGDLAEADLSIYDPRWRDRVQALNTWAEQSVKKPLAPWKRVHKGAIDSFGMLNYGDGVEEMNDGDIPERIHWEGGYYDYMHSVILQFARTSDPKYFYAAVRYLGGRASQWMQRFGNHGRSKLYVPWIVLEEAQPAPLPPR